MKSKKEGITWVDEQGAYVLAAYHAGKFLPMVRWDMYKDKINDLTAGANYNRLLLGLTFQLLPNLKFQANWGHFFYGSKIEEAVGYKNSDQIQIMGLFKF